MSSRSTLNQIDTTHACHANTYQCSNCKKDFCIAEMPVFCPMCGDLFTKFVPLVIDWKKAVRGKFYSRKEGQ